MRERKIIPIDADLQQSALDYVRKQIATMKKYGSEPTLSQVQLDDLVYKVARYPQELRNLTAKAERRKAKEAKRAQRAN